MKPSRAYADYLRDILDTAQKASRFVEGVSFEDFASNDEKVFAVIRAFSRFAKGNKSPLVRRRFG